MPEGNIQRVNDVGGPEAWFHSLPILTKYWFGSAVVLTLSANLNIISVSKVLFFWTDITNKFEIWRFLTPFCYAGPFHFNLLITLYMLVQFSRQYEGGGPYNTGAGGGTADYAFALMFGVVVILITYFPLIMLGIPLSPVFIKNLIFFVCYVWSKRNPEARASIWGVPLKGAYLPFAYLVLSVLMGAPYFDLLHGVFIGHIYYFLVDVVPTVYGKDVLHTPTFLVDFFGIGEYVPAAAPPVAAGGGRARAAGPGGPPNAGARDSSARNRGHNWGGGGRVLGTQ